MARTRQRYSRSKPERKKRKSMKLKQFKKRPRRSIRKRRKRRHRSRKTGLAGEYSSDSASASGSSLGTWSKGKKSFELESFGSGRGSSGPLLGRNPSGTGRNIKAFEEKPRLEEQRIKLAERKRIAHVKAQEEAKREKLLSENLKRFNTLIKGTTLKELKTTEIKTKETKAKKNKEAEEETYLRKILKGEVHNDWKLSTMDLQKLQKLNTEVDEARYYGHAMPYA
jgi:hypothetical protein